jgi:hypothetical protein
MIAWAIARLYHYPKYFLIKTEFDIKILPY